MQNIRLKIATGGLAKASDGNVFSNGRHVLLTGCAVMSGVRKVLATGYAVLSGGGMYLQLAGLF